MTDLLKLILGILASLFRSEHCWRRKILSCGSKSMCFAGRHQSGRTSTILIVFWSSLHALSSKTSVGRELLIGRRIGP